MFLIRKNSFLEDTLGLPQLMTIDNVIICYIFTQVKHFVSISKTAESAFDREWVTPLFLVYSIEIYIRDNSLVKKT